MHKKSVMSNRNSSLDLSRISEDHLLHVGKLGSLFHRSTKSETSLLPLSGVSTEPTPSGTPTPRVTPGETPRVTLNTPSGTEIKLSVVSEDSQGPGDSPRRSPRRFGQGIKYYGPGSRPVRRPQSSKSKPDRKARSSPRSKSDRKGRSSPRSKPDRKGRSKPDRKSRSSPRSKSDRRCRSSQRSKPDRRRSSRHSRDSERQSPRRNRKAKSRRSDRIRDRNDRNSDRNDHNRDYDDRRNGSQRHGNRNNDQHNDHSRDHDDRRDGSQRHGNRNNDRPNDRSQRDRNDRNRDQDDRRNGSQRHGNQNNDQHDRSQPRNRDQWQDRRDSRRDGFRRDNNFGYYGPRRRREGYPDRGIHHQPHFHQKSHQPDSPPGRWERLRNRNRLADSTYRGDRKYKLGEQVKIYSLKPGSDQIIGTGAVANVIRKNEGNRYFVQFKNGIVWDRVHASRMRPETYKDGHLKDQLVVTAVLETSVKGEPSVKEDTPESDRFTDPEVRLSSRRAIQPLSPVSPRPIQTLSPVSPRPVQPLSVDTSIPTSSSASVPETPKTGAKEVSAQKETEPDDDVIDVSDNVEGQIVEGRPTLHVPADIHCSDDYKQLDLTKTITREIALGKYGTNMPDVWNNASSKISQMVAKANEAPLLVEGMRRNVEKSYRNLETKMLKSLQHNESANEGMLKGMATLVKRNQQELRAHIKAIKAESRLHEENRKLRATNAALVHKLKRLEDEKLTDKDRVNELKQTIHLLGNSSTFSSNSTLVHSRRSTDPVIGWTLGGNAPGAVRRESKRRSIWQQ